MKQVHVGRRTTAPCRSRKSMGGVISPCDWAMSNTTFQRVVCLTMRFSLLWTAGIAGPGCWKTPAAGKSSFAAGPTSSGPGSPQARTGQGPGRDVTPPMPATVLAVLVEAGDRVEAGQAVVSCWP